MEAKRTTPHYAHPGWLDLALCWLSANVRTPVVVVYPRGDDSGWDILRSWGVDVVSAMHAEFVVVPFPSEREAAEACHSVMEHVAYAMVWNGSAITTENS